MRSCPKIVRSKFAARIIAVAKAPPKRFSGGGYWEAMHGEMSGWFELRVTGPKRDQYRFFCLIDTAAIGYELPLIVIIAGARKKLGKVFSETDYRTIRQLGEEYWATNPRRIK